MEFNLRYYKIMKRKPHNIILDSENQILKKDFQKLY